MERNNKDASEKPVYIISAFALFEIRMLTAAVEHVSGFLRRI